MRAEQNGSFAGFVLMGVLLCSFVWADGGSSVGNGGDIVSRYLSAARESLKQTLIRLQASSADQAALCENQLALSVEQKQECRQFILGALPQLLRLASSQSAVQFLLRSEPLWVPGPDGQNRQVDARTALGPQGDIEFYYPTVRNFSPVQVVTLIAHEFGHKSEYRGRYVEDNPPSGAFASGRHLLDSAAYALASYGEEKGLIGSVFTLNDRFSCLVDTGLGAQPLRVSGYSPRLFFDRVDFEVFETGIGRQPMDLTLAIDEYGRSQLQFRALMSERHGCRQGEADGRSTRLELVRVFLPSPGEEPRPEEVLASEIYDARNPLCEERPEPLRISYGRLRFECDYTGSVGQTSH